MACEVCVVILSVVAVVCSSVVCVVLSAFGAEDAGAVDGIRTSISVAVSVLGRGVVSSRDGVVDVSSRFVAGVVVESLVVVSFAVGGELVTFPEDCGRSFSKSNP